MVGRCNLGADARAHVLLKLYILCNFVNEWSDRPVLRCACILAIPPSVFAWYENSARLIALSLRSGAMRPEPSRRRTLRIWRVLCWCEYSHQVPGGHACEGEEIPVVTFHCYVDVYSVYIFRYGVYMACNASSTCYVAYGGNLAAAHFSSTPTSTLHPTNYFFPETLTRLLSSRKQSESFTKKQHWA
jgi:hypothetical protein